MSQASNTSDFQASEIKWIIRGILERGCVEEISWWIHHNVRMLYSMRNANKRIDDLNVMPLIDSCFHFQIPDSELVVKVLKALDSLYDMLDLILGHAIQHSRTLPPDEIEKRKQKALHSFDYLTYILHHAYQSEETFRGRWFSDRPPENFLKFLPVFSAVIYGSTETLLTLLQYGFPVTCGKMWATDWALLKHIRKQLPGVRTFYYDDDELEKREKNFSSLPHKVFRILIMFSEIFSSSIFKEEDKEVFVREFREKFCIVWRAVPYPFATLKRSPEAKLIVDDLWEYFWKSHNAEDPDTCLGGLQPRSLKHLSRFTVRERLHQNWKLPHGIKDLNLPSQISKYLNLETD